MNPTVTLNRVLKNCGAQRVYEDNQLVYLLPWEQVHAGRAK